MKLKFHFVQGGSQTVNNFGSLSYSGRDDNLISTLHKAKENNEPFELTLNNGQVIQFKGNDLRSIEIIF